MRDRKLYLFIRLLTCLLLLVAVAIQRDARILGHDLGASATGPDDTEPVIREGDGSLVISTRAIAKDIKGYGGAIPLRITVRDGRIAAIEALRNSETPDFFEKVEKELIPGWIGLPIDGALQKEADVVSGATLSSNATNETIRRGIRQVVESRTEGALTAAKSKRGSVKELLTLAVVLAGVSFPFFVRSRRYRIIQLVLNVIVLGLWSGTFLSYSLLVNYLSNGVHMRHAVVPVLLLVAAFVYPFFGKGAHYCAWLCPMGALQELAGKCVKRKWILAPRLLRHLQLFRDMLWAVLMLFMLSGVFFSWMNYELFTAFLFRQASVAVLVAALAFVALSCVVSRPYCRFVCPTGNLIRITQNPE